jgi:hypothetical protein
MLGFLIQFFFFSVASAGFFITSNLVLPIKAVVSQTQMHLPHMSIRFDEFSPAFAALEDDYYVGDAQDEKIPTNVAAQVLKPGGKEILPAVVPRFELPSLKINPMIAAVERPQTSWKPQDAFENKSPLPAAKAAQPAYINNLKIPHFWLDGKMELTRGLAISDPRDQLRVGWFVEGRKMSDGKIDINGGTYEIKVERMEGELIAELVDKRGYMLGEAIIDLELLARERNPQQIEVHNVDLALEPYSFGMNGRTVSVYHSEQSKSVVAHAEVAIDGHDFRRASDDDGKIHEESISNHSTALVAANHGLYREALVLADLEKEQTFRMFPEKFMESFFEVARVDKKMRDMGVVWGTIRKDGVAASGYRVRLAEHPEAKPIYFTYYIADQKREGTSTDGQFSFVGMYDGDYEVEVVDAMERKIDSKLIAVRNGAVSVAEFDIGTRKTLYVKPFDPFTQTPQGVEFAAMGSNDVIKAQTEDVLKLPVTQGTDPVLIYTKQADATVESSTFASRSRKFQEVPTLNSAWWSKIQGEYKIKVSSGVIIGFIDSDSSFNVYNEEGGAATKIIYFNTQGQIIRRGERPSGFVIYNAGSGLKNLIIEADTGLLTTEAAYVDGEAISLIYKSL